MSFILLFALLYPIVNADVQYGMLDFSPRFVFGSVAKRQADGSDCNIAGFHTCLEANLTSGLNSCCANDHYCYLDPTGAVDCCAIGSDCNNQCTSSSEIAIQQTTTISGNATETFSCSSRACPATTAFLCPASLGGACCGYGSTCGTNGGCTSTINPATVIPPTTATACLTGQFSCPTAEGGGCCNNGSTCTASDSTLLCVATVTTGSEIISPTAIRTSPSGILDSNFTEISTKSSGLSSGAKAGIGVGVALGIVIVIIGIILFAVSRRRAQQYHAKSSSGTGPQSEDSNGEKRFSPRSKNETDYFGPTAKAGPFTETVASTGLSPLGSPDSANRGVPLSPQGPSDIAAPVEIADSARVVPPNPYITETPEKPEFRIEMP